jgi:hypothetical protein
MAMKRGKSVNRLANLALTQRVFDHVVIWGEAHLHQIFRSYASYYNPSIFEQGCAGFSVGSAGRCHQFTRHLGRTPSSVRSGLGFRYTQPDEHHAQPSLGGYVETAQGIS